MKTIFDTHHGRLFKDAAAQFFFQAQRLGFIRRRDALRAIRHYHTAGESRSDLPYTWAAQCNFVALSQWRRLNGF